MIDNLMCSFAETMEWSRPETVGDIPPPCRAHTATLVDRKIFVFGGGQGNMYYNSLYILDTVSRRWTQVPFANSNAVASSTSTTTSGHSHTLSAGASSTEDDATSDLASLSLSPAPSTPSPALPSFTEELVPRPRRAHTTVLYKNRLVVFGGGNGATALNDVWVLEVVGVPPERMRWQKQRTTGSKPSPRGYHTANLVGNIMIVVGGSDGRQTFSDIYCLNLGMEICHSLIRCGSDANVFRYLSLEYNTRGEAIPTACAYVHANRIIFVHNGRS